jgi:hypothetical protein
MRNQHESPTGMAPWAALNSRRLQPLNRHSGGLSEARHPTLGRNSRSSEEASTPTTSRNPQVKAMESRSKYSKQRRGSPICFLVCARMPTTRATCISPIGSSTRRHWPTGSLCMLWIDQPHSSSSRAATPNPSLERTATGKALGPRVGVVHHPSRGPSAFLASAAQLKR